MRRIGILVFLLVVFSVSAFSFVIQPFGLFGNVALVRHNLTTLINVVPFVEFELGQNILTLNNINALLNEEQVDINENAFADALANGFRLSAPVSLGTYVDLKLGALRFVPYVRIDGNIALNLPKTFAELLVGDTLIDNAYNDTKEGFLNASIMANGGIGLMLGDFYVAGNAFVPVLFTDKSQTTMTVSYTSSSTPAYAELNASGKVRAYSRVSLNDIRTGNINGLIDELSHFEDYGLSLEVGFGNDNFGIAVRNIVITPAKAWYALEVTGDGKVTHTAQETDITFEATYSISETTVARLLTPVSVTPPIQITAYIKNDGFIMWGVMGSYWLDGNWSVKGYAGLNIGIARAYYMLGYNQINYAHTIGVGINLFLLNADLKLTATTNSLIPSSNSTPGIGFALTMSGGL
jgi:hypothetical protein